MIYSMKSIAVQAIDEILHKRGHLSLIAGQPLHPLPKSVIAPSIPKKAKSSGAAPTQSQVHQNGTSTQFQEGLQRVAGSSKQASSSEPNGSGKKLQTDLLPPPCKLCKQPHSLDNCPVVLAGSARYKSCSSHSPAFVAQQTSHH
jgi:chromodomain-helicase-DNA-binding protein 4